MSREEFNAAYKHIMATSTCAHIHSSTPISETDDREREVERIVTEQCKHKPIRRVTSAWINNE